MNFYKRINGLVLQPCLKQNSLLCILILLAGLLIYPSITHAGLLDFSAKIFKFAESSIEAGKRIEEISEGVIAPEVESQLKETGEFENLQILLEEFPDAEVQKSLRGYYIYTNELTNKDSLFINELVGSGVEVVAGSYSNPSIGLSNDLPPTLKEVVKLPLGVRLASGIKDFVGAVKTIFGSDKNNKEISKETPGQISQAVENILQENTPTPQPISSQKEKQKTEPTGAKPIEQKPATQSKLQLVPGKITARVVDQFGKFFERDNISDCGRFSILDALGDVAAYASCKTNGRLEIYSGPKEGLLPGNYTLAYSGTLIYVTPPADKSFSLPNEGIDLGNIQITRWSKVDFNLTNELGTPLADMMHLEFIECNILNKVLQKSSDYESSRGAFGVCTRYGGAYDYSLGWLPAGKYRVKISMYGYLPVEQSLEVKESDKAINLGNIALKKQ